MNGGQHHSAAGFTLVEMAIVLVVIALMLMISIPSFHALSLEQRLHGAAQSVAGQVQLARVAAMATGRTQTINFDTSTDPPSVSTINAVQSHKWTLPRGVQFASGGASSFTLTSDGRASSSNYIVLVNTRGHRDTISVESSGLVLAR